MEEIIRQSYSDDIDTEDIEEGRYHLIASDDHIILPKLWEKLVSPGLSIKLSRWQKPCQGEVSTKTKEDEDGDTARALPNNTIGRYHPSPCQRPRQDKTTNAAKTKKAGDKAPILPMIASFRNNPLPLQRAHQDDVFKAANEEKDGDNSSILSKVATIKSHILPLQWPRQNDELPILFRDVMNRAYIFPWHLARSWSVSLV